MKSMDTAKSLFERFLPAPRNGGFRMLDYWVWCGSVIKGEDGRFHMFASRWPKSLPMHPGWIVASEVVRAVSYTPEGPYSFEEVVLPARGAEYWDGRSTHNPHIMKIGHTYVLYYMGSTHPFADVIGEELTLDDPRTIVGRSNKRIGIATSNSVFGPWQRYDTPIQPTRPGHFDSFLTSNPAPCLNPDGSILLIYKARSYEGYKHGEMTIGASRGDTYMGPYQVQLEGPIFPPETFHLEDPFVWKTSQGYELIAKDMDGTLCGEKHCGIHAFSPNGIDWMLQSNPKAYSRTVLWDDGVVQTMGSLERPFLLFENGKPTHLFAATADGPGGFQQATETWNMVIPIGNE
ncbi:hypothetical protein PAECIP111891_04942 [Paenibacillus allorhizoplanae]|uniref:Glycosyl hydrolase family 43 n=1 Tax=Paenibacillus allorhizoplanae TaxID=2905648 RepID=A0ABM9CPU4_9BACL|nr:glycoside hydrolase family protein [Paenibacillus allorhizoplanae]CAH1219631.1 hypothetical protein PAECIP111891_04942 [Paenibacillus allorhizoplanae]